jgi:DNA replication protein DnaC
MARTRRAPKTEPLEELQQLAIDLDLTALAEALPEMLDRAEKKSPSFTELALEMMHHEARARRERRLNRSLKRSKLGDVEGIEGFDFSCRPKLDERVVKELLNCRFVEEARPVLCLGRPGLGKTRIAKTIAYQACLAGYSVLAVHTARMLEELIASEVDHAYKRVMRRYTKPDLLLLDEFGYEPFTKQSTAYLFRLVGARHRRAATIITANTGFANWKKLFPSEAAAVATTDRLVDDATILRFTGKSFRSPRHVVGAALESDTDD